MFSLVTTYYGLASDFCLSHVCKPSVQYEVLNLNPKNKKSEDGEVEYDEEHDEWVLENFQKKPSKAKKKAYYSYPAEKLFPLTMATGLGASKDVVELIYNANPKAIESVDKKGNTVLHWACRYKAKTEVIMMLIDWWPDALEVENEDGQTPLMLALEITDVPFEIIQFMVGKYPEAVGIQDRFDRTTVQVACSNKASIRVVELLGAWFAEAYHMKSNIGAINLHQACNCKSTIRGGKIYSS